MESSRPAGKAGKRPLDFQAVCAALGQVSTKLSTESGDSPKVPVNQQLGGIFTLEVEVECGNSRRWCSIDAPMPVKVAVEAPQHAGLENAARLPEASSHSRLERWCACRWAGAKAGRGGAARPPGRRTPSSSRWPPCSPPAAAGPGVAGPRHFAPLTTSAAWGVALSVLPPEAAKLDAGQLALRLRKAAQASGAARAAAPAPPPPPSAEQAEALAATRGHADRAPLLLHGAPAAARPRST